MSYSSTRALALGDVAASALTSPGLPTIAWAPPNVSFNPADYDPKTFAQNQYNKWSSAAMQTGIDKGRSQLSAMLNVSLPAMPAMPHSEVSDWTTGYMQAHGVPTNVEDGAKMVTALAHAQATKLGVPPEWIAASDVMMHPPTSVEEGFAMVANVGKAYFEKYGVPLLQNELLSLSANLGMIAQAIPVQFAIAGVDALKDGKLSGEEIAGIAVQAACYACGLLLQGIGIPAPLGALLAGVIAQGLTSVADNVIHADDAQTRARKAAYAALDKQRSTLMKECAKAAQETWNKTQEYWDQVLLPIQALLDVPEVAARLQRAGGIRYYGRNVVTLPPGVVLPESGSALAKMYRGGADYAAMAKQAEADAKAAEATAAGFAHFRSDAAHYTLLAQAARKKATDLAKQAKQQAALPLYQYGFDCLWWEGKLDSYTDQHGLFQQVMPQNARPFPDGCLYFGRAEWNVLSSAVQPHLDPTMWAQKPYWVDPTSSWDRCASYRRPGYPSFWSPDRDANCDPTMKVAAMFKYDSSLIGAETRKMEVRLTPYSDHNSPVRTKWVNITRGAMVDGKPNAQAALMFWGAKRQATVHSSYSQYADSSDAAQWKQFGYIDPGQMEVYTIDGKMTAKLNLPFNYCDVNQWSDAVQTASAAAALVQQDIIRTVAWQVGAEQAAKIAADWKTLAAMTPTQQQQLVAYVKAVEDLKKIAAMTPDEQRQLVAYATAVKVQQQQLVAYATAVKAKQQADMIAARLKQAQMQARALGSARAASGAYASALKARLSYQYAQARAQTVQKTGLIVGGIALGAFLLWKVAAKRK
jgi:hypothetical protein